jgi:enoyl-CoA hydratase/carnithine racemase
MEMLLTGNLIPARRACEMGLVNRVAEAGQERHDAITLAQSITSKSAYVLKIGKEAFYNQLDMNLADAYKYGANVMAENMMVRDAEEGIGAFIEKREPKWEDR